MNPLGVLRPTGRGWPAEHSVTLRVSAAAAVCVAIAACTAQGEMPLWFGALSSALVCAGGAFSYRRRTRPLPYLKVLLGVAVIGAFAWFFVTVSADAASGQLTAVEAPLAALFAAMQAAHAFDMPSRRDLGFSLAGSATLIAVAGAQAIDLSFGFYVGLWAVLVLSGLHAAWSSMVGGAPLRPASVVVSSAAVFLIAALLLAFLPAPRPPSLSASSGAWSATAAGAAAQPAHLVPAPSSSERAASASGPTGVGGYLGFAGQLDTALRPGLGDEVVLQVRADLPTYWVAETFDSWSGRSWTETGLPGTTSPSLRDGTKGATQNVGDTSKRTSGVASNGRSEVASKGTSEDTLVTGGSPFDVAPGMVSPNPARQGGAGAAPRSHDSPRVGTHPDYQTFYLASPVSNLVLHADQATAVWIPTRSLYLGDDDTIRTRESLGAGSVYSVESTVVTESRAALEKANGTTGLTSVAVREDLELPHAYPRVAALARRITAHDTTVIGEIVALEHWIGSHTRYTLDIPPLAPGQDTVVQFLLGSRRGFCEQISTALTVMLRTLGVPAREAVGYVPGTYDPITGLYEEQAKDAHAWVQVWFPGYGWQNFDPTAFVPTANPSTAFTIGHDLLAALHRVPLAATASAVLVVVLAMLVWRRHRRRPRTWHAVVTRELERAAAYAGTDRGSGATLSRLAAALDERLDERLDQRHGEGLLEGPDERVDEGPDECVDEGLDEWPDEAHGEHHDEQRARLAGPSLGKPIRSSRACHLAALAAAAAWGGDPGDLRPRAGRHLVREARRIRRAARHDARHRSRR